VTQAPPAGPPPGWLLDPVVPGQLRWWDGTAWTAHIASPGSAPPPRRRRRPGIGGAAIILVAVFGLWILSACAELFWEHQHGLRLVILMFASSASAAALLYLMTRRLRPSDELPRSFLIATAAVGGLIALVIPSLVEPPWEQLMAAWHLPLVDPVIAGPLEETTKLAVVAIVARWVAVRTARTGLFVGGAVGVGYAIFENIDYAIGATGSRFAFSPAEHFDVMLHSAIVRTVMTPFAHPVFTAISAAALFAASRGGRLRFTPLVVGGWAVAMALHSLWDDGGTALQVLIPSPGLATLASYGWLLLISIAGVVIWRVVAGRADRAAGLTEPFALGS
jgi:RsiW-degrading membrane proteinase PrsW (M82 family)